MPKDLFSQFASPPQERLANVQQWSDDEEVSDSEEQDYLQLSVHRFRSDERDTADRGEEMESDTETLEPSSEPESAREAHEYRVSGDTD